jgi:hypothetical protein
VTDKTTRTLERLYEMTLSTPPTDTADADTADTADADAADADAADADIIYSGLYAETVALTGSGFSQVTLNQLRAAMIPEHQLDLLVSVLVCHATRHIDARAIA